MRWPGRIESVIDYMKANQISNLGNLTLGVEQRQPGEDEPDDREKDGENSDDDFGVGPLPPWSLVPDQGRDECLRRTGGGWKGY